MLHVQAYVLDIAKTLIIKYFFNHDLRIVGSFSIYFLYFSLKISSDFEWMVYLPFLYIIFFCQS